MVYNQQQYDDSSSSDELQILKDETTKPIIAASSSSSFSSSSFAAEPILYEVVEEEASSSTGSIERETSATASYFVLGDEYDTNNNNTTTTTEDSIMFDRYVPESVVVDMHHTPRFGHSNRIGLLASRNELQQLEYAKGIKQFTLFIIIPFFIWSLVLLYFKYKGKEYVGCAAGGNSLNMIQLHKAGIKRKIRRRYLLRSYRIQSTFLIVGTILIPIITGLLMKCGSSRIELAWEVLLDITQDVKEVTDSGIHIIQQLETSYKYLQTDWNNELVLLLQQQQQQTTAPLSSSTSSSSSSPLQSNVEGSTLPSLYPWCPNVVSTATAFQDSDYDKDTSSTIPPPPATAYLVDQFNTIMSEVETQIHSIIQYMDDNLLLETTSSGLRTMSSTTEHITSTIEWSKDHDWLFKLLLMIVNVVSMIMIVASWIISKLNFVHIPSRCYLAYIIVPLWIVLCGLLVYATAMVGIAMLLNADFCAGGPTTSSSGGGRDSSSMSMSSPQGAMEDAILANRLGTMDREYYYNHYYSKTNTLPPNNDMMADLTEITAEAEGKDNDVNGEGLLVYEAFLYYANGCLDDFPLAYLSDLQPAIEHAVETVSLLATNIKVNDTTTQNTVDLLGQYCGADFSSLPTSLQDLAYHMDQLDSAYEDMIELTQCHSISPLIRRVTHGELCTESAYGLTWIWSCLYLLTIFAFTMLTTRASLFNTVITRDRSRKPRPSQVKKEFDEYKNFMAEYYDDTENWALEPKRELVMNNVGEAVLRKRRRTKTKIDTSPTQLHPLKRGPTFDTDKTTPTSNGSSSDDPEFTIDSSDFENGLDHVVHIEGKMKDDNLEDALPRSPPSPADIDAKLCGVNADQNAGKVKDKNDDDDEFILYDPDETEKEDNDDDESYDSWLSSDSEEDDDDDDDASALASVVSFSGTILSDAKSLAKSTIKTAKRTIQTIRALPSMLGGGGGHVGLGESSEEEEDEEVDFNIPESPYPQQHQSQRPYYSSRDSPAAVSSPQNSSSDCPEPLFEDEFSTPNENTRRVGFGTPNAPQKVLRFLGRSDAHEDEMEPLTMTSTPSQPTIPQGRDSLTGSILRPRHLAMSPMQSPVAPKASFAGAKSPKTSNDLHPARAVPEYISRLTQRQRLFDKASPTSNKGTKVKSTKSVVNVKHISAPAEEVKNDWKPNINSTRVSRLQKQFENKMHVLTKSEGPARAPREPWSLQEVPLRKVRYDNSNRTTDIRKVAAPAPQQSNKAEEENINVRSNTNTSEVETRKAPSPIRKPPERNPSRQLTTRTAQVSTSSVPVATAPPACEDTIERPHDEVIKAPRGLPSLPALSQGTSQRYGRSNDLRTRHVPAASAPPAHEDRKKATNNEVAKAAKGAPYHLDQPQTTSQQYGRSNHPWRRHVQAVSAPPAHEDTKKVVVTDEVTEVPKGIPGQTLSQRYGRSGHPWKQQQVPTSSVPPPTHEDKRSATNKEETKAPTKYAPIQTTVQRRYDTTKAISGAPYRVALPQTTAQEYRRNRHLRAREGTEKSAPTSLKEKKDELTNDDATNLRRGDPSFRATSQYGYSSHIRKLQGPETSAPIGTIDKSEHDTTDEATKGRRRLVSVPAPPKKSMDRYGRTKGANSVSARSFHNKGNNY